jgi:hypothetical protein
VIAKYRIDGLPGPPEYRKATSLHPARPHHRFRTRESNPAS